MQPISLKLPLFIKQWQCYAACTTKENFFTRFNDKKPLGVPGCLMKKYLNICIITSTLFTWGQTCRIRSTLPHCNTMSEIVFLVASLHNSQWKGKQWTFKEVWYVVQHSNTTMLHTSKHFGASLELADNVFGTVKQVPQWNKQAYWCVNLPGCVNVSLAAIIFLCFVG